MREDSRETARNMISMEEYLRKRQAVRRRETVQNDDQREYAAETLKLVEILYV